MGTREALALELFRVVRFGKENEFRKLTTKLSDDKSSELLLTAVSSESERNTILHVAARHGYKDLVEAILAIKSSSTLLTVKNSRDNIPMHTAAAAGHAYIVRSLINHGQKADQENGAARVVPDMLIAKNAQGDTPFHEAARRGHKAVMEMLMKTLDIPDLILRVLADVNNFGESPVSLAFIANSASIMGRFPNAMSNNYFKLIDITLLFICKYRETASSLTILAKSSSTVEALLKAKPDIILKLRGLENQTLLHMAILKEDFALANIILRNRPELTKERDINGRTPLHYAAVLNQFSLVRRLLEHDALAAYAVDDSHMMAVHLAAQNGNITVLRELYACSPNVMEFTDKKHQNVLHMTAKIGKFYTLSYLMELPETQELINSTDEDGNTPLHLAAQNCHSKIVRKLSKDPRVNIKAINNNGNTALDIVNFLQTGASPNTASLGKEDPQAWNFVISNDMLPETEELNNSADKDGNTPLHLAAQNCHSRIVRNRVNIKAINKDGNTLDIVDFLQTASAPKVANLGKEDPEESKEAVKYGILFRAETLENIIEIRNIGPPPKGRPADQKLKDIAMVVMLVATLVTTVTFAVVFQIPGGYVSGGTDVNEKQGMAVLSKDRAFQWFIIFDVLAMISSMYAILCILWAFLLQDFRMFFRVVAIAIRLTWCAVLLMALAFATGMLTVLRKDAKFAISIFVFGLLCLFPFLFTPLLLYWVWTFTGEGRITI